MKVAFRTDASIKIGTGHIMRCLTLASRLQSLGARCRFICRQHYGDLIDLIRLHGHQVDVLPSSEGTSETLEGNPDNIAWLGTTWQLDAKQTRNALDSEVLDWLVIDHYGLDHNWENQLGDVAKRIMVIDDLANRHHVCHLLLDQNLGRRATHYDALVRPQTLKLIGPRYALLRPEFSFWRRKALDRPRGSIKKILVSMGGIDRENITGHVLNCLAYSNLPAGVSCTVILGSKSPWRNEIQEQIKGLSLECDLQVGISDMAKRMCESDLAIGAAGSTAYERCCLGLPTIQLVLADNQNLIARALNASGAAITFSKENLLTSLRLFFAHRNIHGLIASMSSNSKRVTDGLGVNLVVERMIGMLA